MAAKVLVRAFSSELLLIDNTTVDISNINYGRCEPRIGTATQRAAGQNATIRSVAREAHIEATDDSARLISRHTKSREFKTFRRAPALQVRPLTWRVLFLTHRLTNILEAGELP
jgi:hypothetical protein